jgi:hypothetical protein
MADMGDPKTVLHHYLQLTRDDLIWKLDGLGERDVRLPRTSTGNNQLGVLKHCLNVEADYFGPTFGREFPTPEELVHMEAYEEDPQADWYARFGRHAPIATTDHPSRLVSSRSQGNPSAQGRPLDYPIAA